MTKKEDDFYYSEVFLEHLFSDPSTQVFWDWPVLPQIRWLWEIKQQTEKCNKKAQQTQQNVNKIHFHFLFLLYFIQSFLFLSIFLFPFLSGRAFDLSGPPYIETICTQSDYMHTLQIIQIIHLKKCTLQSSMAQYRNNKYQLAHLFSQENIKTLKVLNQAKRKVKQ